MAGDQLVVPIGVTHISLPLQEYNRGSGRKKEQTNKTNNILGVNSRAERELCNTLCMCRLTLVWIRANFYKATGMQTHLPSLWLDPHVMMTRLSARVSEDDRLCPCPFANCRELLCPTNSLLASRYHFRSRRDFKSKTLCLVSRQYRQRDRLLGGPPT